MKKTLTLLSLLLCLQFITAQAQQNIYVWKQGSVSVMRTSDVDSITFDAGSWFYTISCSTPVDVTTTSAKAIVSVSLGTGVKSVDATPEIGVCFSEDSQPTIQDHKVKLGSSMGDYTVTMADCASSTKYYYRAYVTLLDHTFYSDVQTFTTQDDHNRFTVNGHEFVDLGLPSGLKWATCNVGANAPEAAGDYFAWGETEPKSNYGWSTYKWYDGSTFTKYTLNGKTTLDAEDDAATQDWGEGCRMPTVGEFQELLDNCTSTWTEMNGVYGYKFTSNKNSAFVFFPASGYRYHDSLDNHGSNGLYWSSSLNTGSDHHARYLAFDSDDVHTGYFSYGDRRYGFPVRAVTTLEEDPNYTKVNGHEFVDLSLPSGLKWATCNVGANAPEADGDYFAWGETEPKSNYGWSTYKWYDGSTFTKYTLNGKTTLDAEDDAATQNWGEGCRMPTVGEFQELLDNCTSTWTEMNGVYGYKFTSNKNSAFVFFPASGYRYHDSLDNHGSNGLYWSSSLNTGSDHHARYLTFDSGSVHTGYFSYGDRCYGFPVRAVTQ